jgi:hypothetical protein
MKKLSIWAVFGSSKLMFVRIGAFLGNKRYARRQMFNKFGKLRFLYDNIQMIIQNGVLLEKMSLLQ